MFQKVVPVNNQIHANKRVKDIAGFGFASHTHIAYLTLQEFTRSAPIFPIVFLEDKQKDEFRPVALLGLKPDQNLFVDAAGKWLASYIPAIIRRYPFALTPSDQDGQFVVCIDEGSELVSDTEGAALFDITGAPTQVIDNVKRYLSELQQMELVTREQLIAAFEYLALLKYGPSAAHWNHRAVAERLGADAAARDDAECLANLYERARYAPDADGPWATAQAALGRLC